QAARLSITGRDLATLHTDKPAHGTVITLKPGNPWTELTSWSPEQGSQFPPSGADDGIDTETDTEQFGVGVEGERR
ncbi:MAG: hypothetical protein R3246_02895, partial [Acidimicrobiia bacterium]|nr:hypothetical protein [Acidimicrobiia bacterium]